MSIHCWIFHVGINIFFYLDAQKGQCLVASRDLEPLAIILMDQAALVAPHHGGGETVCLGCMSEVRKTMSPLGGSLLEINYEYIH